MSLEKLRFRGCFPSTCRNRERQRIHRYISKRNISAVRTGVNKIFVLIYRENVLSVDYKYSKISDPS